jgi:hypothetical protein
MLNARVIASEEDLAALLARCGFSSEPCSAAPWLGWHRKWHHQEIPITRHLTGFGATDYCVTVEGDAIRVYFLEQIDDWWHRISEISSTFADSDIKAMLENATSEDGVLRDYWRENERRNAQHRQPDS